MKIITLVFILFVQIYACISLIKIVTTSAPDFSVYYDAAIAVRANQSLYDNSSFFTAFNYPPVTSLLFIPYTFLPYQFAQGVWVVGSYISLFGTIIILYKFQNKSLSYIQLFRDGSICFLAFPTKFTLGMGQSNLMALFVFLLAFWISDKQKFLYAGVELFLAVLLKPQLLPIICLILWQRKWNTLASFISAALFVTFGFILFFGFHDFQEYGKIVPELLKFTGREIYYNQSVSGMMARLFVIDVAQVATMIMNITIVFGFMWKSFSQKSTTFFTISMGAAVITLIEPLGWQHHFVFLIPAFYYIYWNFHAFNIRALLVLSYILIGINIKQPENLYFTFAGGLLLSHVTIGAMIIYLVLQLNNKASKT